VQRDADRRLLRAACLGTNGSLLACDTFVNDSANAGCVGCIDTPNTASSYGALIDYSGIVYINIGGCVDLVEPCNLPCAKAFEAVSECTATACDPVLYCTTGPAYSACEQAAQTGTCACDGFAASSSCLDSIAVAGHPAFATCLASQANGDFQTTYTAVATFICGP
jgi:hypothetical protein